MGFFSQLNVLEAVSDGFLSGCFLSARPLWLWGDFIPRWGLHPSSRHLPVTCTLPRFLALCILDQELVHPCLAFA